MTKIVLGAAAIVTILALALGVTGFVSAQAATTPTPAPGYGSGSGRMGGRGYGMGMMGSAAQSHSTGWLHEDRVAVYADQLGMTVDDLNARLAKGETLAQIAASQGLTADQFRSLMTNARTQAIDQAVKDGTLTQAQADWMKQHGAGWSGGAQGMRGAGLGRNANPNCPYASQPNS